MEAVIVVNNRVQKSLATTVAMFLAVFVLSSSTLAQYKISLNPYENVGWDSFSQYKANLHTHTTESDGSHYPSAVIDMYRYADYGILAITDHNRVTWPWDNYGRIPEPINMVAVQGNEISGTHHMVSYFSDFAYSGSDEHTALMGIGQLNGLAVFAHPVLYNHPLEWHLGFFTDYPHLLGIEVANQTVLEQSKPADRVLWDNLLTHFMPERPVWGFAVDDMHSIAQFRHAWCVFPLDRLTEEEVRKAMEKGQFYFTKWLNQHEPAPVINQITVDEKNSRITIQGEYYNEILWYSDGVVIHRGETINLGDSLDIGSYVRAELRGAEGNTTFTNPFGITRVQ